MKRLSSLSLVGPALVLLSTPAVANNSFVTKEIALLQEPGNSAKASRAEPSKASSSILFVHDKPVPRPHGQATLNAYLDAHCLAAPDAVAVGGGFAGACGGLRAADSASARN